VTSAKTPAPKKAGSPSLGMGALKRDILRDKYLYFLLLPGAVFFIIFKYIPMIDLRIAFMDYNIFAPDQSKWVGFAQFTELFTKPAFLKVLRNTLYISVLKMIVGFPLPIILALMMNEMRNLLYKKVSQTLLYLPYFISWVIMGGLVMNFLDVPNGAVTMLIKSLTGQDVQILTSKTLFVPMLVVSDMYKNMGWGTIIYFAALSGVDPQLYEAAAIDGAKRFRQLLHITLPAIIPTVVIMLILNCNNILNAGFDQIFMLYSASVYDISDIIDTYVFRLGIEKSDYSFTTAAGMFKSVVAMILIVSVNYFAKKNNNEGLW
jgi:putative aldouronate transport system permease protein